MINVPIFYLEEMKFRHNMNLIIKQIKAIFEERGTESYGSEAVTQLQHALQCASLAEKAGAIPHQITAALLHDIGHILHAEALPMDDSIDLHDLHEEIGYHWLVEHFGDEVAGPVKLHVEAKRYLCTIDESYEQKLSPTSFKSYQDQGGKMSASEKALFENDAFFKRAIQLRRWDDLAKDPAWATESLEHFIPYIEACLK